MPPVDTRNVPARWHNVTVRYPYAHADAIRNVSLQVDRKERVLLLGPSGSGKSTISQTLTGILPRTIPADVTGDIFINGQPAQSRTPAQWANDVAQLHQDAEQTLCGLRVEDELAFNMENAATAPAEMETRIDLVMARVGLPEIWRQRRTASLSGGEKQMVALAAMLIGDTTLFVADEPTANLAPEVADRINSLLLGPDRRGAVLVIDHRLDRMIENIDRVVVLDKNGRVMTKGPPGPLFRNQGERLDAAGIWTSLVSRADRLLHAIDLAPGNPPLDLSGLLNWLDRLQPGRMSIAASALRQFCSTLIKRTESVKSRYVVRLRECDCAPLFGPVILRRISVGIREGEIVGILGANGAGKSSLGYALSGLVRIKAGRREGKAGGFAFQNAEAQFSKTSVREEVAHAIGSEDGITECLTRWGLTHMASHHPFDLSHGQKRRLALAIVTARQRWPFLVLDEPTAGLDRLGTAFVIDQLLHVSGLGSGVAVITHDLDFALRICDRVLVIADGGLLADGVPVDVFRNTEILHRAGLRTPDCLTLFDWLEQAPC